MIPTRSYSNQDSCDPGMNGESQLILAGNLGAWFYQTLPGINCNPMQSAFKHIILQPDLTFVRASHKCLYGLIRSEWKIEAGHFRWDVVVPPNTTATVHVPTNDAAGVGEGGKPAAQAEGGKFLRMEDRAAVYGVGAGQYTFVSAR